MDGLFYRTMTQIIDFEEAAAKSKNLPQRPTNEELLNLYAIYKQATEGDNNEERPGGFDFRAIAKHNAWEELKGKSSEDAKLEYVKLVNDLFEKYSD